MIKGTRVIFFIVILLLAGSLMWLRYGVNHHHIQAILSNALGSEYSVELQSAQISPLKRAVYLTGLTISDTTDNHLIFEAEIINISGIGLRSLLGKNLSMASAHVKNFRLVQSDSLIENGKGEPKVDTSIQRINIRNLNLVNGAVKVQNYESENYLLNELFVKASIDFRIGSVDRNHSVGYNRLNVDTLGVLISGERYHFSLSGINFTRKSERLTLSSLKLIPVGGYDQFNRASAYRVDMVDLEIRDFTAYGIVSSAFEHDSIIKADSLVFGYFDLHVAKNKQLPKKPDEEYAKLLNEIVQNLGYGVKLKLISFKNAHIRYSEQDENGVRPGTISFMNSTIHIREINSRSPAPAVLTAATYLQNHSELITELRFTLDDETFRMTGAGELQHFDLTQLNSILMDLEGIKIESGEVHELNFDFEMIGDISTGRMHILYDDLKIKFVDMDDYSENLRTSVRGFITDKFLLSNENLPHDNGTVRIGKIDHEREPGDAFFTYLWQSLRSGILDVLIL